MKHPWIGALLLAAATLPLPSHAQSSGDKPGAVPGAAPMPVLDRLVAEALQGNREIQAARGELDAAQARVLPAGALDDPMLEAGVLNLPVDSFSFRRDGMTMKMIGLAQKFPFPGKRGLREEVATRNAESVGHAYQETVNRVVRDVKLAYFDLALVAESARLAQTNRRILEQFLQLSETRYAVGQASQADVLKAQTQLSRMDDELLRLAREREAVEADLARALGRPPAPLALQPGLPPLRDAELSPPALEADAIEQRPQLLALQRIVERSDKALQLARKDYYPDFDVRFSFGQRENALNGTPREDMVSLTVAINLPVWRASKLDPRAAEAAAMREQAQQMYQAQRDELHARLRQQRAAAEQSLRSARLSETGILPQARLAVEAALAAYKVNRVEFLSLLDSQMTVFNFELSRAASVVNYHKALAEIDFLTGRQTY